MDSREFIERMKAIEDELETNRKLRHERNAHVNDVIQEEMADRLELEQRLTVRMDRLTTAVEQIARMLRGDEEWEQEGIISQIRGMRKEIQHLQGWKRDLRMYALGIASTFTALGTAIGWFIHQYK